MRVQVLARREHARDVRSVALLAEALGLQPTGEGLGAVEGRAQLCDPCVDLPGADLDALPLSRLAHQLLLDHKVHGLAAQLIQQRHPEARCAGADPLRAHVLLVEAGKALIADGNTVDPHRVAGVGPLCPGPAGHEHGGQHSGQARDRPHGLPAAPALAPPPLTGAAVSPSGSQTAGPCISAAGSATPRTGSRWSPGRP